MPHERTPQQIAEDIKKQQREISELTQRIDLINNFIEQNLSLLCKKIIGNSQAA